MNDYRRTAQRESGILHLDNLLPPEEILKRREEWKYVALEAHLTASGRDYEFEYGIDGLVYDLALLDSQTIVEFDGPDHKSGSVAAADEAKKLLAESRGFVVVRRPIIPSTVISPDTITGL